jgi:hypothetical protein
MFVFVFAWTPALQARMPRGEALPVGTVFATFMVWKVGWVLLDY